MNDNEKKAHDIAIAIASIIQKSIIDSNIKSNIKETNIDVDLFFYNYKHVYDKIIALMQAE